MMMKPAMEPRTMPTRTPGEGPEFRPAYVVGMASICVCCLFRLWEGVGSAEGARGVEKDGFDAGSP